ncbi:hypothetical protein QBC43DRAFT_130488 [Cladorrhinum sp. PSN259]|nr:hypothetical protein QBC43DRAFT_130488 [Cladorrhinum sp. PSN259]
MQHSMQVSASAAPPSPSTLSPILARTLSPVFEKFSRLIRRRTAKRCAKVNASSPKSSSSESQQSPTTPLSPTSSPPSFGTPDTVLSAGQQSATASATMPHSKSTEVGGRGIVPQIDAPRGASRHVEILCKGVTVDVPITNDTTVRQVLEELQSAGQPINPDTAVITEQYSRLGIERRLRREERIRDVLSSWGTEKDNALVLSSDIRPTDRELDLSSVAKRDEPHEGFVVYMYFLRGPHKWSKRYIHLYESGQMSSSKKEKPRNGDKDLVNICHLSDYDIYTPTEAQMRKVLKPPKRYCYAIKSQQKATTFENTSNYVLFFSTDDGSTAQKFRSRVQAWRGRYLANKLELHKKKEEKSPQIISASHQPRRVSRDVGRGNNGYSSRVSMDGPNGTNEPLVDVRRMNKPLDDWTSVDKSIATTEIVAPKPMPATQAALIEANAAAFAANGLLGNAYEERRQQARKEEKMAAQAQYDGTSPVLPFSEGPTLLNQKATLQIAPPTSPKADYAPRAERQPSQQMMPQQMIPQQQVLPSKTGGWFPSAAEHSAQQRAIPNPPQQTIPIGRRPSVSSRMPARAMSVSQHRGGGYGGSVVDHHRRSIQPQPLVDLTPEFVEAPQWSREGRGRGVRAPEGSKLVDLATGPLMVPGRNLPDSPPKALIHRREVPVVPAQTLLQQQESKVQQGVRPTTSNGAAGLGRRGTVKSTGMGGGTIGGTRPGTSGSYGQVQGGLIGGESNLNGRTRGVSMGFGGGAVGAGGAGGVGGEWNDRSQGGQQYSGVESWVKQQRVSRSRGMSVNVGGGGGGGGGAGPIPIPGAEERRGALKVVGGRGRNGSMMSQ